MIILFDVNETLLDLSGLRPQFGRIFGDEAVMTSWFSQLLQSALVATVTGTYRDFGELALEGLELIAERKNILLSQRDKDAVFDTMRSLPPHADVKPGLERLRAAGFRLAALTNSPYRVLGQQLSNAGIAEFFEQALSVDEVQLFKPHAKVYEMAAQKLGVSVSEIRMVAAHNWDTTGAIRAGAQAAFLARPGAVLGKLDETPSITGSTLSELVEQILATDSP